MKLIKVKALTEASSIGRCRRDTKKVIDARASDPAPIPQAGAFLIFGFFGVGDRGEFATTWRNRTEKTDAHTKVECAILR